MSINDLHVSHTMKPISRLNFSINTRYKIYLCTQLVYIWLQVLCKDAYTCYNIHDQIFADFDFEEMNCNLEWQGEMIVQLGNILATAIDNRLSIAKSQPVVNSYWQPVQFSCNIMLANIYKNSCLMTFMYSML